MGPGTKHALDFNDAAKEARNKFKLVGRWPPVTPGMNVQTMNCRRAIDLFKYDLDYLDTNFNPS